MEFDNQIAIPAILAFAAFFSALPLVIFDAIDFKLCAGIFILGLLTLPLNVLLISGLRDVAIIDVVTLNFSGGTSGLCAKLGNSSLRQNAQLCVGKI